MSIPRAARKPASGRMLDGDTRRMSDKSVRDWSRAGARALKKTALAVGLVKREGGE